MTVETVLSNVIADGSKKNPDVCAACFAAHSTLFQGESSALEGTARNRKVRREA
jgi:hypothetical protein